MSRAPFFGLPLMAVVLAAILFNRSGHADIEAAPKAECSSDSADALVLSYERFGDPQHVVFKDAGYYVRTFSRKIDFVYWGDAELHYVTPYYLTPYPPVDNEEPWSVTDLGTFDLRLDAACAARLRSHPVVKWRGVHS